jgi:hypothetical protein
VGREVEVVGRGWVELGIVGVGVSMGLVGVWRFVVV